MPSVSCHCGAKYKIPESSLGKKAKCKKCDNVFTLQLENDGIIPLAPQEDDSSPAFAAEIAAAALPSSVGPRMVAPTVGAMETLAVGRTIAEQPKIRGGYWDNVLWTILFPADPRNLVVFVMLWITLGGLHLLMGFPFLSYLKLGLVVFLYGWYCGYRFRLVEGGAAGDEQLPELSITSDWLDDALYPFLQWIGSWILVIAPSVLQLVLAEGIKDPFHIYELWAAAFSDPLDVWQVSPVALVLIYLGLFLWPMIVLTVALGGFGSLARVDLMFLSLARSFAAYVVTVALVALAAIAESFATARIYGNMMGRPTTPWGFWGWGMLADLLVLGISAYCAVVSLRCIGLYYHHFKEKFAWNWG